jgi:hypothetical protein
MGKFKRRDFLKTVSAAIAAPAVVHALPGAVNEISMPTAPLLPDIPTCESMRSIVMTHKFLDLYAWPGLTNQWGCAQASMDVVAVRSIAFPPYAQGEMNVAPLGSNGELLNGVLYIDGEYFTSTKTPIDFVWQPDCIERRSVYKGLELKSTTIVPFKTMSVAVKLTVSNMTTQRRKTQIKLAINAGVSKSVTPWNAAYSPGEYDNERVVDQSRNAVVSKSKLTDSYVVQGVSPKPASISTAWIVYELDLAPRESAAIVFVNSIGGTRADAARDFDSLVNSFDAVAKATTDEWNYQLRSAFTPNNDRFSGYVATLVTSDESVKRIYHSAVMTALYFRRTTPHSVYGTTYATLMPRYWETTTFLWDISLSAMLLAMLDPEVLRKMMETWMTLDIHKHFGTEFLTGAGVGPWYSVNDYAMSRMAKEYLRWTGDRAWLDKTVGGKTVFQHLVSYAEHWRELDTNKHGLADYGGVLNLLEAVSSYVHEVAGLNAANVHNLRFAAELVEHKGDRTKAAALRREANELGRRVQELYVPGRGIWKCRLPDGSYNEVHHCYDFGTTLMNIGDMMPASQKREMVDFFVRELKTPTWMRALSTHDLDVTFSIRPDHQWTGAYCSWPALALSGLYAAGAVELALDWMKGLAKTGMQGPYAQAHFTEAFYTPESNGGAAKSPSDQPYINDWACVSGCNYLEPIVDSIFGINAGLFGNIAARPQFGSFDPNAELRNINYQGKRYIAGKNGIRPA